ncbi:MAG: serine hydrolase [Roseburia sp.]|nr:serine hydrolase [Roseburia sp.]MCM1098077.1 serine hydrolase [Ruminococcus flavefaciens]
MKCTNKEKRAIGVCLLAVICCLFTGCGSLAYSMPYVADSDISSFNVVSGQDARTAVPFASALCVVTGDVTANTDANLDQASAAALFSLDDLEPLYAKNVHEVLHPASLTKVMTALVALKYGSLNQQLTATSNSVITEAGAVTCSLKPGDTMTLDQALRIMLVYSANDAAMMVAENIGGSVEHFIELMNEEARRLGATNTNFANPHGLTDANHYTTVYDLYLIFNEALKYETFTEIIQMTAYQTVYYDKNGKEKNFDRKTTNQFLRGEYNAPANVTVIGGKTGTTSAAGHCLMIRVRDINGAPYIAIVMGTPSAEALYGSMIDLLDEINK